jgi:8-oxo-dGTP diphosphatase
MADWTEMTLPTYHVVVGLLVNARRQVLIARRPPGKLMAGLWEFPGGKIEQGESQRMALTRELTEELGIEVLDADARFTIEHTYPDRHVILNVWQVARFSGEPVGCEGQQVRWVTQAELSEYTFPIANQQILAHLAELFDDSI